MFKRKVYDQLLEWKREWNGKYACLLEGARRVGKTTIAEEFARNEYDYSKHINERRNSVKRCRTNCRDNRIIH